MSARSKHTWSLGTPRLIRHLHRADNLSRSQRRPGLPMSLIPNGKMQSREICITGSSRTNLRCGTALRPLLPLPATASDPAAGTIPPLSSRKQSTSAPALRAFKAYVNGPAHAPARYPPHPLLPQSRSGSPIPTPLPACQLPTTPPSKMLFLITTSPPALRGAGPPPSSPPVNPQNL